MISMESKIKDVYSTPVGHDILYKVLMQMGVSEKVILSPVVSGMKLKTLAGLTQKMLGPGFYDAFITLLNTDSSLPASGDGSITETWWKEAVFYQIYPRSFRDGNNDGIGDLRGIIEKLDYLRELGITALWLSPIYDSPQDDNGYDIRDYHKIFSDFGTMEDFDELLQKAHEKGMRLIMDLVVNHTSDEHKWFQEALADEASPYRDYYFFRKGSEWGRDKNNPPTNWTSFFAGSAWNYYEEQDLWALHLFSKKQMDLNWDNPAVREDVIDMVKWWLEKGVDGFRMDVINYISKQPGLPAGDPTIGALMGYTGIEHYFYGPRMHEYFREIRAKAFEPFHAFSVGETPGMGMNMCLLITGEERKELDMVFSFDHLETPGHVRFDDYKYDLNYLRDYMTDWMENYGNNCWMSLFYNNHDNPRMISKINPDSEHAYALALLLAVIQFTLKGTPFVFQGDEMGLVNYPFKSIDEITDVEAKGYYQEMLEKKTPAEAFATILAGTREHTRIPLPWNFEEGSKISEAYPAHLRQTPDERVFRAYQFLISLRKSEKTLVYGDFEVLSKKKNRFVYKRSLTKSIDISSEAAADTSVEFIIDCNLASKPVKAYEVPAGYKLLYSSAMDIEVNAKDTAAGLPQNLAPYEARIWKK